MLREYAIAALVAGCRLGFEGTPSDPPRDGDLGSDVGADADAANPPNLMFTTSTTIDLCAVGVAGADAECAARAASAGLPGTYVALVSGLGENAIDRLGVAAGWIRRDGNPFAASVTDLFAGQLVYPARLTESGDDVGLSNVVSATAANGTYNTGTTSMPCRLGGLSSQIGRHSFNGYVVGTGRVMCLGVDRTASITLPTTTGRNVFVTGGRFDASMGRVAADSLCASEASAAGLPGSYLAFLSTETEAAADRFSLTGATWVRPDGIAIMNIAADLATWNLVTGPDRHIDGTVEVLAAWTGGRAPGTPSRSCNSWTSSSAAVDGLKVDPTDSWDRHYGGPAAGCSRLLPVLCFEQ